MAGTSSVTPDKINAVAVIKKLLDNITRRQQQLDDLWRVKKTSLEQALQLQVFEKSMLKVGGAKDPGRRLGQSGCGQKESMGAGTKEGGAKWGWAENEGIKGGVKMKLLCGCAVMPWVVNFKEQLWLARECDE